MGIEAVMVVSEDIPAVLAAIRNAGHIAARVRFLTPRGSRRRSVEIAIQVGCNDSAILRTLLAHGLAHHPHV